MQDINVFQLAILFSMSFMSAFSVSLNNYAKDANNNKQCSPLLYISECLVSGLSGFFISILAMILNRNILICILSAGIGGFIGRKLLIIIIKLGLIMFSMKRNIDVSKLEDILSILDQESNNRDNNRKST